MDILCLSSAWIFVEPPHIPKQDWHVRHCSPCWPSRALDLTERGETDRKRNPTLPLSTPVFQGQSTGSVDVGTSEAVKVKILLLGDVTAPKALRIELSSENDLFFFYWHVVDSQGFTVIQEQQKLMADFSDFAGILIKMLNNCIKETHHYLAVFVMMKDGQARLDFIQNMVCDRPVSFFSVLSGSFGSSRLVIPRLLASYCLISHHTLLWHSRVQLVPSLARTGVQICGVACT